MGGDPLVVRANLASVYGRIRLAEQRFGRAPGSVRLVAVSKRQSIQKIRAAWEAGQGSFGESYVQEALVKMTALEHLPLEWHFIGRIQRNKTQEIATRFHWVHGLADLRHAERLSQQRPVHLDPLRVFIQVNLSGEVTKAGIPPEAVADFIAACRELPNLRVMGLMTLPPPAQGEAAQRKPFQALRQLRDRVSKPCCPLPELSMGMSADLEAAIAEGATWVRVGTAIFGKRPS